MSNFNEESFVQEFPIEKIGESLMQAGPVEEFGTASVEELVVENGPVEDFESEKHQLPADVFGKDSFIDLKGLKVI